MSTSFFALSSAIVNKIKQSNLVQASSIFNYEKAGFSGYPAVTVTPHELQAQFADNSRNEMRYFFSVKVYQERLEQGDQASEQLMMSLVDDLNTILDGDLQFGSQLVGLGFLRPVQVQWRYNQAPQAVERVADITVEVVVVQ